MFPPSPCPIFRKQGGGSNLIGCNTPSPSPQPPTTQSGYPRANPHTHTHQQKKNHARADRQPEHNTIWEMSDGLPSNNGYHFCPHTLAPCPKSVRVSTICLPRAHPKAATPNNPIDPSSSRPAPPLTKRPILEPTCDPKQWFG